MTTTLDRVTTALADSRFAAAKVKDHGMTWDGHALVTVEWAWEDAERAAITAFLAEALPTCKVRDHVAHVRIYQ